MFTKNKKNSTEITILKSGDLNQFIVSHKEYKTGFMKIILKHILVSI